VHRTISLAVFPFLVVIAAALGGLFTGGEWYQAMIKPSWTPPALAMASAWALLYVLMALAAWMVWDTARGAAGMALGWWVLQLLLGIAWSWMIFGLNRTGWAMAVVLLWLLVVVMVIKTFAPLKPGAAMLMIPQAAWLVFLAVLNFYLWRLNGGGLGSIF